MIKRQQSATFGGFTKTKSSYQFACGYNNIGKTDTLLEVGNGGTQWTQVQTKPSYEQAIEELKYYRTLPDGQGYKKITSYNCSKTEYEALPITDICTFDGPGSNVLEAYENGLVVVGKKVQQTADGVEGGFDFTNKNSNATGIDNTLTGIITYGASGNFASAFGGKSAAIGKRSHSEGSTTIAKGQNSHAEGSNSVALGTSSHAEGIQATANGDASHSEGNNTQAIGHHSHSEGNTTIATGMASHAEGYGTQAKKDFSHTEGGNTIADGAMAHAEGNEAKAFGEASHAEGYNTVASGDASHAGGWYTIAGQVAQTVIGAYNDNKSNTIFEVGNGSGESSRANAFVVLKDGRAKVYGEPKDPEDVVRLQDLSQGSKMDEERVREIVTEETADLQAKTDESLETESKQVVGAINELKGENEDIVTELAVINTVLEQSGLVSKYKATIEDTYAERVTADGANVLNGSKAILEKVVGNTVKCNNLIPAYNNTVTNKGLTYKGSEDGTITVSGTLIVAEGSSTATSSISVKNLKNLKTGTYTYCLNASNYTGGLTGHVAMYNSTGVWMKNFGNDNGNGFTFTLTEDDLANGNYVRVNIWFQVNTTTEINVTCKPMLNEGSTALPYEPYFTGLKNASFGGIESTGRNLINQDLLLDGTSSSIAVFEGFDCIKLTAGTTVIPFSCKANTQVTLSCDMAWDNSVDTYWYYTYADGTKSKSLFSISAQGYSSFSTNIFTYTPTKDVVGLEVVRYGSDKNLYVKNMMLNMGAILPYEPYVSNTLDFPKTEMPLGRTIDFESKKITDYGVTIVLKGGADEGWDYTKYKVGGLIYNTLYCYNVMPTTENRTQGVVTDGTVDTKAKYGYGYWWIGTSNPVMHWVGILDLLGFSSKFADVENPTREEQIQATRDFKAYLAQRYADGNPVTIRYVSKKTLQAETDFTAEQSAVGNEYTAYNGGTETVLENDGAEYGADNTLSQNYIIVTGVK